MFEVPMFVWVIASVSYCLWAVSRFIEQVSDTKSEVRYREENQQRMQIDRERFELEKEEKLKSNRRRR